MNPSDQTVLTESGLSDREAQVYLALLEYDEVPISQIIEKTDLHPQIVYRSLEALAERGLVIESTKRHRRYVRAESPDILKKDLASRLAELEAALPRLDALRDIPKEAVVRVAKGVDAVRDLRAQGIAQLAAGETYFVTGASGDRFYEVMGGRYAEIERERVKKGILRKIISFESQRANIERLEPTTEGVEYRYLPADYPAASSTNIFKNTVAIIVWSQEPIVITIESAAVARSYRDYFDQLWQIGVH